MRSAPKDIPTPETLFKPKRAVRLSYLPPPHILPVIPHHKQLQR